MAQTNNLKVFEADIGAIEDYLSNYAQELDTAFNSFSSIMRSLTGSGGVVQDALISASLARADALASETYARLADLSHQLPNHCNNFQAGIDAIDDSTL